MSDSCRRVHARRSDLLDPGALLAMIKYIQHPKID